MITRGTGISTGQALESLSCAIRTPGTWVEYTDHAQSYAPSAAKFHANQLRMIVNMLELKEITVDYSYKEGTIRVRSDFRGVENG